MPGPLREKLKGLYQYANEYSLRTRLTVLLRDVLKESTLPYSQKNGKNFVNNVVDARNRLAHGTQQVNGDLTRESADLTYVILRLLLMHVGCSEAAIASAVRRLPFSSFLSEAN